jgi:hypothetical protein
MGNPPRKPSKSALSKAKYEEMCAVYAENPTIKGTARICGVTVTTARKYINKGDPSRKLLPIRKRVPKPEAKKRVKEKLANAEMSKARRAAKKVTEKLEDALNDDEPDNLEGREVEIAELLSEAKKVALQVLKALRKKPKADLRDALAAVKIVHAIEQTQAGKPSNIVGVQEAKSEEEVTAEARAWVQLQDDIAAGRIVIVDDEPEGGRVEH